MAPSELPLSKLTREGRMRRALIGLQGPHGLIRATALEFLLRRRRPLADNHRTFLRLERHLARGSSLARFNRFLRSIHPDLKIAFDSRESQLDFRLEDLQETAYTFTGRPIPLHDWMKKHGILDISRPLNLRLQRMAITQTRLGILLTNYFKQGFLGKGPPLGEETEVVIKLARGRSVLPPDWEISVKYRAELKEALRRFRESMRR